MVDETLEALTFVIRKGLEALRLATRRFGSDPTDENLGLLISEADTLSSGLARFSSFSDSLPTEITLPQRRGPEISLSSVTELLVLMNAASEFGFCSNCGDINPAGQT